MDASLHISRATPADAGIISRIIERSIRVGCAIDHRNHPLVVEAWVRRNNLEQVQTWLSDPLFYLNLVQLQDKPIGVAMATVQGRVAFCYVQPEWFRRGAGRALVQDLETWLATRGFSHIDLDSTRTSEAFFQRLGYGHGAAPFTASGLTVIPMDRQLASPSWKADRGAKS